MSKNERNPLLIPKTKPQDKIRGCPKCNKSDYSGHRVQGVILWKCAACGNQWSGGLPSQPQDVTKPFPPLNPKDKPTVDFVKDKNGEAVEVRRKVDLTPEYRRGLPIPSDGDDEW